MEPVPAPLPLDSLPDAARVRATLGKTLIYLTSDYSDYARSRVEAASVAARQAGFGVVCVTGRSLQVPAGACAETALCNVIYRLIERIDAAGVICDSGMLGQQADVDVVRCVLDSCSLPLVSLGLDLPGVPSVVLDDVPGMQQLMQHLVEDPDRQRFVFVRGGPRDVFPLQRERVFREALLASGRTIDETLVIAGSYEADLAFDAVARVLEQQADIDVIVAANDTIALSAARAVIAAGYSIPGDIAVTGFDDVPDARRLSPALTTVRQPLADMARIGVSRLIEQIGARSSGIEPCAAEAPQLIVLRSELVVRGSSAPADGMQHGIGASNAATLHTVLQRGVEDLPLPPGADLSELADALCCSIETGSQRLARVLEASTVSAGHAHWWSSLCDCISALDESRPAAGAAHRRPVIVAALAPIRERIWALRMAAESQARSKERGRARMQLQMGSSIGLSALLASIDGWLQSAEPQRYFLIHYDRPGPVPGATGRLVRAFVNGHTSPDSAASFNTCDVLPAQHRHELERGVLLLNPVYAGAEHYGYVVIDPQGVDVSGLDSAARCIGNAFRSRYLYTELERQASRLQQANDELSLLANRDGLTGLANRMCFEQRLRQACEAGGQFAICFLDLDGFKPINDRLGHEVGDDVLRAVATKLESVVDSIAGENGFVARLGGDEFTLLLRADEPEPALQRMAAALLAALSEPFLLDGRRIRLSASIGGSLFPEHGPGSSDLLRHADAAMYAAKAAGKNGFVLHGRTGCPSAPVSDRRAVRGR